MQFCTSLCERKKNNYVEKDKEAEGEEILLLYHNYAAVLHLLALWYL